MPEQGQNDLDEKNFIHEGIRKDPSPLWIWFIVCLSLLTFFWVLGNVYLNWLESEQNKSPFLRVTNRDFSLFLWHNPEFMRINSKDKLSYLPDFDYVEKLTLDPKAADRWVSAPPEVLFLYHVWNRLLKDDLPLYVPDIEQFQDFLSYAEEWQPENWQSAPTEYPQLIRQLRKGEKVDLSHVPFDVKIAYTGWLNFTHFGDKINTLSVSYQELDSFLKKFPHYARPYWKNILIHTHPNYLIRTSLENKNVPNDEFSPFLKAALYTNLHNAP